MRIPPTLRVMPAVYLAGARAADANSFLCDCVLISSTTRGHRSRLIDRHQAPWYPRAQRVSPTDRHNGDGRQQERPLVADDRSVHRTSSMTRVERRRTDSGMPDPYTPSLIAATSDRTWTLRDFSPSFGDRLFSSSVEPCWRVAPPMRSVRHCRAFTRARPSCLLGLR